MPVLPPNIRKRTGTIVAFDAEKINTAIKKAFFAVTNSPHEEDATRITEIILKNLEAGYASDEGFVPGVEDIQDLVEIAIMEAGFYDVARAYIVYRFQHEKIREYQKKEVKEKIERRELLVKKRDGRTELFVVEKIQKSLLRAAEGFEDVVNIDALIEQVQREVYDGMTTRDIAQTLVLVTRSFIEQDPAYSIIASRLLQRGVVYKDALGDAHVGGRDFVEAYRRSFVNNMKEAVALNLLDKRVLDFNLEKLAAALVCERDDLFKYMGVETLCDRYFVRDKNHSPHQRFLETPQIMWMRIAIGLAFNEDNKEDRAISFYHLMSQLLYIPSTPTLFNSATTHAQLSSCYLGVVDDNLESIFKSYKDYAFMARYDGGVGYSWTKLRATGANIKTSGVASNGVVTFLKILDSTVVCINRAGRRRGACAVYLEPWHLDVEDFIELRKNTGDPRRRTPEMNTALWIPDLFMKRVREGGEWTLFSPDETPDLPETYGSEFERRYSAYEQMADDGKIKLWKRLKARDLWKRILSQLYESGHPWITFKDASNVRSPQDHVGVIHNSNLCTEIALNNVPDEEVAVCNLGSVNLPRHIKDGALDQELLKETVTLAMRMLDNVIDITFYPISETRNANMRHRPVGLGLMGFQDAVFKLGYNFDSDETVRFADESMELISYYAVWASSQLARERGAYQTYHGSKWDRGLLPIDTLDVLERERGESVLVDKTTQLDWRPVRESIQKYGMRNSNCMAMAPTATIGNIAGVFPTIEPIYKNIYVKSNISGTFIVVNDYLVADLKKEGLWNDEMLELIKGQEGSLQNISAIPQWIKDKHKEVFAIDPVWLVKAAAQRAKWIDQSQSLNIFYAGTSGAKLSDIYMYAWQSGLKTTYYLRTLGATSVEQSSVALKNQLNLERRASQAAEEVAHVREAVKVAYGSSGDTNETLEAMKTTPNSVNHIPKLCAIEDPDCESCQ